LLLGGAVNAFLAAVPWMRNSWSGESFLWGLLGHLTGLPLGQALPSFIGDPVDPKAWVLATPWFLAAIAAAWGLRRVRVTRGRP
jgi:hypothetical protein